MILKYYALFKDFSAKKIDWNLLRNNYKEAPYFVPFNKDDYTKSMDSLEYSEQFGFLKSYILENNITQLISMGAGKASIEYQLKKELDIKVVISDLGDSIHRLKGFDIFDDAVHYNILEDEFSFEIDDHTLFFIPRVDTEFNQKGFTSVFEVLAKNKMKHIAVTPAELITLQFFVSALKVNALSILKRRKLVFCGYARTMSEFVSSWADEYTLTKILKNKIFFLQLTK